MTTICSAVPAQASPDLVASARGKRCSKCGEEKARDAFSRNRATKDGLQCRCKVCDAARMAAYQQANREKIAAYYAAYKAANREKVAAKNAAYRAANRDKVRDRSAAYIAANRDKIRARSAAYRQANREKERARKAAYCQASADKIAARQAAYYASNRDKITARQAAYYAANREKVAARKAAWFASDAGKAWFAAYRKTPTGQLRLACSSVARRLELGKLGKSKLKLLGYTAAEFAAHLGPRPEGHHLDHILPVSLIAKLDATPEQKLRMAMALSNLRWLPDRENISRGVGEPWEWLIGAFRAGVASAAPELAYELEEAA